IVVPNFNRAATIGRTLNSIVSQTYTDWSVVVADNASTDSSVSVVEALGHPRIRVVQRLRNIGFVASSNLALGEPEIDQADYIAHLHADDCWEPNFLERMVTLLDGCPTALMGTCAARQVNPDDLDGEGVVSGLHQFAGPGPLIPSARAAEILSHGNSIFWPTVLARRELHRVLPAWDHQMNGWVDWLMWLRAASRADIAVSSEPLARYTLVQDVSETAAAHVQYAKGTDLQRAGRLIELEWTESWPFAGARSKIRRRIPLALLAEAHWLFGHGDPAGARLHARLSRALAPTLGLRLFAALIEFGLHLAGIGAVQRIADRLAVALGTRMIAARFSHG
ncbi:MAG TPA: glycosyltransferase family A protein, partial [Candidatus Dormibacteraeota bacterium]|nr:glycosyltransferase family A protein [Candidatus Dormibacteraeota bacterium]